MSIRRNKQEQLRGSAESQLACEQAKDAQVPQDGDLLHELQVHVIELEMQNEALLHSGVMLEESRDRYVDFYDFAPVGYLTLSHKALIAEINLTGAAMLGEVRSKLLRRRFSEFLAPEHHDRWYRHFMDVRQQDIKLTCELDIPRGDGQRLHVQLDSLRLEKDGHPPVVCIVLTDITELKRAETALRESEGRQRLLEQQKLIQTSLDGFWVMQAKDARFLDANNAFCGMVGYSREELLTMCISDLEAVETREETVAHGKEVMEVGYGRFETRHRHKQGHLVDLEVSASYSATNGGEFYVFVRDISERKRAELERQAHARSLECLDRVHRAIQGETDLEQMMSDVLDVVLAIFNCNRAYLLYPCDPAATEWRVPMERTGPEYPGAHDLGDAIPMNKEVAEVLRLSLEADHPKKFGHAAEHPMPQTILEQFGVKSQMLMALHPKLDKPWQFGIHQCSHARIWTRDEEALFEKIGWRLSDALTGLLMYRNLQASEREFRTLAENLPDVLIRYDREGRRTYVNPAMEQTFLVSAAQLIGKTLGETNTSGMQMPESYRRALAHTLATGERSELEMQLPSSDENMHTGLCFIVAERAEDGQITGAITIGHDITERKRNEAELERHRNHLEKLVEERTHALSIAKETAEAATRAKSHFLAAASHDLRQPISAIGLYNDALVLSGLREEQMRMSRNLTRSVESLGEMLNELLDIAKLDAGKLVPQPAVIQSAKLLGTIASEFDSAVREKHLSLNLFCPRKNLALFTDKNLLLTILRNLIGNAVKYTNQGGILVSIRQRDNRALIQVWDTGIGISPEQLDLIFDEYFQANNSERNRAKGAGLGLAIVKRVSEALGNRVSCRSRLGRGSVFEFSLPLTQSMGEQVMPVQSSASNMGSALSRLVGKRIMVIEDDAMAATALKSLLEAYGMQVIHFSNAEEALGYAEAMEADHYISDYHLPGMDGLQLLDAIQTKSAEPIKAVILTGNTSLDQIAITQSSRWKVLSKPFALPELLSAMEL